MAATRVVSRYFSSTPTPLPHPSWVDVSKQLTPPPKPVNKRRFQSPFRRQLMQVYGGACVISGCDVPSAIDAAHLVPVASGGSSDVHNGLLLRKDLHRLLDDHLLTIDPDTLRVYLMPSVRRAYCLYHGKRVYLPDDSDRISQRLIRRALSYHFVLAAPGDERVPVQRATFDECKTKAEEQNVLQKKQSLGFARPY